MPGKTLLSKLLKGREDVGEGADERIARLLAIGGVGEPTLARQTCRVEAGRDRYELTSELMFALYRKRGLIRLILDCRSSGAWRVDILTKEVLELERGSMRFGEPLNFLTIVSTNDIFPAISFADFGGSIYYELRSALAQPQTVRPRRTVPRGYRSQFKRD